MGSVGLGPPGKPFDGWEGRVGPSCLGSPDFSLFQRRLSLGLPSHPLSFFCPVQMWEMELGLPLWASLLKAFPCSLPGIHANSNLNHLKYSLDHAQSPTYAQARLESGSARTMAAAAALSDKLVILVCNRACSGQQGKR